MYFQPAYQKIYKVGLINFTIFFFFSSYYDLQVKKLESAPLCELTVALPGTFSS